jgi:large subunit ribosomal protein L25
VSDTIGVEKRETTGSLRIRRLRNTGKIPAVLYGHGEETLMLSVNGKDLNNAIRLGHHVVKLAGAVSGSALIKEIQWDALGVDVLHLDFARIDEAEAVTVTLPVDLKGNAPGTKSGGTLRHVAHELEITCPANVLPDKLEVNINHLELDQTITAGQIVLPQGAFLTGSPDDVVCQCVVVEAIEEVEEAPEGEAAEPEVIGRKKEDDEDSE